MSSYPLWSQDNPLDLARYVNPEAKQWLRLPESAFDLHGQANGRLQLVKTIYESLQAKDIYYDIEEYHPSAKVQRIRTPDEILNTPGQGTCLDLALLLSSICLGYRLMPVLIILKGHALVAVSLRQNLDEWAGRGRPWKIEQYYLTHIDALRQLIEDQQCILIECTGFAASKRLNSQDSTLHPETLGRNALGLLSFERAMEAGNEQLKKAEHSLRFGLDIAAAHYISRIEPYTIPILQKFISPSEYLLPNKTAEQRSQTIGNVPFRVPRYLLTLYHGLNLKHGSQHPSVMAVEHTAYSLLVQCMA